MSEVKEDDDRFQRGSLPQKCHSVCCFLPCPLFSFLSRPSGNQGQTRLEIDHATLNRWVVRYSPQIAAQAQIRKRPTLGSWRVDETYIKIKSKSTYLYRAVDRGGQTLEFMLTEHRNLDAARRFFRKAIAINGIPNKISIDKSGASLLVRRLQTIS